MNEYKELLKQIHDDLLLRAEMDYDNISVVNLSSSLWIKLKEIIKD